MIVTPTIRMGRLRVAGDAGPDCQAKDRRHCGRTEKHPAEYRLEVVDPATAVVRGGHLCLRAAGAWAYHHDVPFPPGMWQD